MSPDPQPDTARPPLTWERYRTRALAEAWRLGIPPPPDDDLRTEYIRLQGDLARLRAWMETNP